MRDTQAMELEKTITHPCVTTQKNVLHTVDIEDMFWQSLDLDSFTRDIDSGKSSPTASVIMATGHTHDRCNSCGPADTTRADCTPRPN